MKILVTGSKGFVGKNLIENLKNIRDGKNRTRKNLTITEIFAYDVDSDEVFLEMACRQCDFVFNLAGVNRPKKSSDFMQGNFEFASKLLNMLKRYSNTSPVMFSSSLQASLTGRFMNSEYGKSKLAGEKLFFRYSEETGNRVLVYRLPNLFGKWCRPNYNSVVATFCHAIANDEMYTVNDRTTQLELLYIDDLINELLDTLEGKEHRCEYPVDEWHSGLEPVKNPNGRYCYVPETYHVTLGEIVDLLQNFKTMPSTFIMPEIPQDSFAKKLYSTYLSYLPQSKMSYRFKSNIDERGIFTELIRTLKCGQISINVAKPGITRGQHWHNSKWEIFIVVSGHGLIQERKIGTDENDQPYPVRSFEVTGDEMRAVQILPGYAHNIINLSDTENLITVMWANESFDEKYPDTFFEKVE